MSDYISEKETIETIWNVFNSYGNCSLNFDISETKAIRKFCSRLQKEIELLPTISETEIIRKAFERVVERLDEEIPISWEHDYRGGKKDGIVEAIKILKEECGISE